MTDEQMKVIRELVIEVDRLKAELSELRTELACPCCKDGKSIEVITTPETFEKVIDALAAAKLERNFAEVTMVPDASTTLDADTTRKALRLIELLEEHEDVQNVYANFDIPEETLQAAVKG